MYLATLKPSRLGITKALSLAIFLAAVEFSYSLAYRISFLFYSDIVEPRDVRDIYNICLVIERYKYDPLIRVLGVHWNDSCRNFFRNLSYPLVITEIYKPKFILIVDRIYIYLMLSVYTK